MIEFNIPGPHHAKESLKAQQKRYVPSPGTLTKVMDVLFSKDKNTKTIQNLSDCSYLKMKTKAIILHIWV